MSCDGDNCTTVVSARRPLLASTDYIMRSIVRIHAYKTLYNWVQPFQTDKNPAMGQSIGTGFFIENRLEGHPTWRLILTCSHVVENCFEDKVTFVIPHINTREIPCTIVSICPDFDLAVLLTDLAVLDPKISKQLGQLVLGNSDDIKQGDRVTAYGYPMAQKNPKMSDGIISGREGNKIQHTSPISPGNSGGPLLLNGMVIGVNSSGITAVSASNIGYAVPINIFALLKNSIQKRIPVIRKPQMGFCYHSTTLAEAALNMSCCGEGKGVYIYFLFKKSPLRDAGIREGSTMCAICWKKTESEVPAESDWYPIDSRGEVTVDWSPQPIVLEDLVYKIPFESFIHIKSFVPQEGKSLTCGQTSFDKGVCTTAKLQMRDVMTGALREWYPPLDPKPAFCTFMGMCVMNLAYNHAEYKEIIRTFLKLSKEDQQDDMLVITYIVPGMPLYEFNTFHAGDIIEYVNGCKVSNLKEYKDALCVPLQQQQNGSYFIDIRTKNNHRFVMDLNKILLEEADAIQKMFNVTDLEIMKILQSIATVNPDQ